MGLTMGTGPFGKKPAGTFNFEPDPPKQHALYLEPSPRRVRGVIGGDTVVDSTRRGAAARDRATCRSGTSRARTSASTCSRRPITRRIARSRATRATGRSARAASWPRTRSGAIPRSCPARRTSRDRVAFYWDAVEHWYEEDEEVFVHPRDPYHRVDLVPSSRNVRISLDGVVLAESSRPLACFETNLPTRWYLPKEDLAADYEPTQAHARAARTRASRRTGAWAATTTSPGATRTRSPLAAALHGLVAFYDEVVDVDLDGERQERGYSPFAQAGALKDRGVAAQVGSNA